MRERGKKNYCHALVVFLGTFPASNRVRSVAGGLNANASLSSSSPLSSATSSTCRGVEDMECDRDRARLWASAAAWRFNRAAVRGDGGTSVPEDDCRRIRLTMIWLVRVVCCWFVWLVQDSQLEKPRKPTVAHLQKHPFRQ